MNEVAVFQYENLDATTADFLRMKESNMREIVSKAYTALGEQLKDAQDTLAKNGYGCFEAWCEYIGMKPPQVRRLIHRYTTIRTLCSEQAEMLEDLPVTLAYEISSPSAESTPAKAQAKAEVLQGDIDTLRAYKARITELEAQAKQATEKAEQAESARQIAEEKAQQFEQLFGEQSMYDANVTKVTNGDAITYAVYSFQEDTRSFIEKYAHLTHFGREFDGMIDEGRVEYLKAIDSAMDFLNGIKRMLTQQDAIIIEQ